jgi:crossover junction endodeoxyribonuclease RuvC
MPRLCHLLWMRLMRIMGVDPSLTATGYASVADHGKITTGLLLTKHMRGLERLQFIRNYLAHVLDEVDPSLVAYEGYAMGVPAGKGRAFDLGELGGVLKLMLWERKIPILIVPPTSLKLFATGSGNADKEQVKKKMARHRGGLFKSGDEADAYALLLMGMAYSERRLRPRDPRQYQNVALRGTVLVGACVG